MDDDRVVISSALVFSPETVASRAFNVVFRGYEQTEVRAFLKRVADEMAASATREAELRRALQDALTRAAHPEVNEDVLTNALGEHAARLLTNAREAAAAMLADAETRTARVLQETEGKIARVRSEADTVLARRTEEAERMTMGVRQAAEADARALRERARAEAEAEVESARSQGREMVAEARSVRERMLADLTRRQRIAEAQVEQLRSVRQRLLQAYGVVRRTVDEATAELGTAEAETSPVVEAAADHLAAPTGPATGAVPTVRPEKPSPFAPAPPPEPAGRPIPTSGPVQPPMGAPKERVRSVPPFAPSRPPQEPTGSQLPPPVRTPATGAVPTGGPGPVPSAFGGLGTVTPSEEAARPPAPAAPDKPETPARPETPDTSGRDETDPRDEAGPSDEATPPVAVEALFARMRAGQEPGAAEQAPVPEAEPPDAGAPEAPGARIEEVARPDPAPPGDDEPAPDEVIAKDDESLLYRRDELLDPIDADLVRQLKRVLQDEQNEVLDRLRRQRRPVPEATLPDFVSQTERYQVVAAPLLRTAAHRGAGFVAASTDEPIELKEPSERIAEEWAADLAVEIVIPLRERLEAALNEAGDADESTAPDATIADRLSASYRQWKVQQIEQVARHHATTAFVRGAFTAAPEGAALRWIVDDEVPCPDCDDNALAGPTPKGQKFPTGQTHPPAHQGCRCVLVTGTSPP
ncbi:MAG TPA: DivIVA domain-containing protein [Acidimicrobiales bacterium]|nr:DivIVA domain-containing protein [Acidimicrobiales bacterium]